MKLSVFSPPKILIWSFRFYFNHFIPVIGLSLIPALGRALQMKATGQVSSATYTLLEILVEITRIFVVIFIMGGGDLMRGFRRIRRVFNLRQKENSEAWQTLKITFRIKWPEVLWNFLIFCILAYLFNLLVANLADLAFVSEFLKKSGVLEIQATASPIIFFVKNLTIIPFTVIFEFGIIIFLLRKF